MAILGKDKYEVESNVSLDTESYESLILLYQPLIGASAVAIYLSLNKLNNHTDYSFLCLYTGLDIDLVEHGIIMLERYRLLKTFKKEKEDHFIHVLLSPFKPLEFITHYVYGLELRKHIGNHNFNLLNDRFKLEHIDKSDYQEITEKKIFNVSQFSEDDLEDILKSKNGEIILPNQFNYDLFLQSVTNLQFPHVLRSKENLNLIGELALIYGISEERMQTLVFRSINYNDLKFETSKLIERVRREKVVIDESINKYDLPPEAFLQLLQNGAAVSTYNKKLIEQLVVEMLLAPPVVNRLLEYVMETNNNRLIKNYVLQVATTWKSFDIRTLEEANELIKKTSYQKQSYKQPKAIKREKVAEVVEENYTEEEKREIAERLKRFGEKYGKNED